MRKVLFDTNVLVDYLIGREPGCSACKYIIATAQEHQLALYATALSMKDAYYLVCANLKRLERNRENASSSGAVLSIVTTWRSAMDSAGIDMSSSAMLANASSLS